MSKQEEIRQLIDTYIGDVCLYPDTGCTSESVHRDFPGYCDSTEGAYQCLMKRLGELGVVMTAERELPEILQKQGPHKEWLEKDLKRRLLSAGWEATEPLIDKEEK